MHNAGTVKGIVLRIGQALADALGQINALAFHHDHKVFVFIGVDVFKHRKGVAVGNAVVHVQHHAEASRKGVYHTHKTGSHAAQEGGDHELFAVFIAHHVAGKVDLLAEVNGLFGQRIDHHVAVRAGDALKAVHVGVDTRVKILVAGHAGGEVGIKQHLLEHGVVAVHAQLDVLGLVADDARARSFGTRARKGGNGDLVGRGVLDQFPALIVFGLAGIVQQVAHALAGIKHAAAAKGQQGAGRSTAKKGLYLIGVAVHAVGGGFVHGVHIEHHVLAFHRQLGKQILALKKFVHKKHGGAIHRGATRAKQIAKLGNTTRTNHIVTDIFRVAIHSCPLNNGR